jgi:energy-coupling factor transporter transmembrane protein EcfT
VAGLGPVSVLDPSARLLCLSLLSSASLFAGWPFSAFVCAASLALLLRSGIAPVSILKDAAFIAAFAAFTAALRLIGLPGALGMSLGILAEGGAYGARLLAAFLVGRLLYASTSISELRDAATRMTRRLPLLRRADLGLVLSMAIGFIPLIFEEWRSSLEASRSRGLARRPSLGKQALFVAAFLRRLMLRAVAVPEALTARGWTRERGIQPSQWKLRDSCALVACMALLLAAILRIV